MTADNEACKELEQKLVDAQIGRISSNEPLEARMGAQVFMPVEEEKAAVLNVRCSERAEDLVKDYPGSETVNESIDALTTRTRH